MPPSRFLTLARLGRVCRGTGAFPSAERVFPHRFPVQRQPPCAVALHNASAGTICSVLTVPSVLASRAERREEAAVIQVPAG